MRRAQRAIAIGTASLVALTLGACDDGGGAPERPEDEVVEISRDNPPEQGIGDHPTVWLGVENRIYLVDQRPSSGGDAELALPDYSNIRIQWEGRLPMPMSYWIGWVYRELGLDLVRSDNKMFAVLTPPTDVEGLSPRSPVERVEDALGDRTEEACSPACAGWIGGMSICLWTCSDRSVDSGACPWCGAPNAISADVDLGASQGDPGYWGPEQPSDEDDPTQCSGRPCPEGPTPGGDPIPPGPGPDPPPNR